jgi:hypothetical protein
VQHDNDAPHRTTGQIPRNIKYVIGAVLDWNMTQATALAAPRRPVGAQSSKSGIDCDRGDRSKPASQDCSKMPGNG